MYTEILYFLKVIATKNPSVELRGYCNLLINFQKLTNTKKIVATDRTPIIANKVAAIFLWQISPHLFRHLIVMIITFFLYLSSPG